ncbi:YbgC/FadM family acyl-CoA thioesterase [Sphaerotilus montanus]|nr:YbgC/FadM family acyl-CoA thioesterase [Sphaerotilus montanus]
MYGQCFARKKRLFSRHSGYVHGCSTRRSLDAGGVVFYANYLKFFERGRTEWLRGLGFSQEALRRDEAAMFVVSDTTVRYLRPARLDDEVVVTVRLAESGKASLVIDQQALRGGEVLAEGRIRIGCVDAQTLRPRRIPPNLLASIGPA